MSTLLALAGLLSSPVLAQDNAAAGLFTEARQLPLVSQALTVRVEGDEATVHVTQVFANDGPRLGQADYALHLPAGASVEGFGFWTEDRYLEAALQTREEARAAHTRAAAEGRASAILDQEGAMHRFSVHPVEAHALQQVETTLRVPVEVEGGRRELRLPVDRFLGQGGAASTVTVHMHTHAPMDDLGLSLPDGTATPFSTLSWEGDRALLAASTHQPLVLRWQEETPPLDLSASVVETPDGLAVGLRLALDDAEAAGLGFRRSWRRVALFVDGSLSMARRKQAVEAAVGRAEDRAGVPVMVRTVVGEEVYTGLFWEAGRRTTWDAMDRALLAEDCGADEVRCVVLTDAQLPGLSRAEVAPAEVIVLHDAHEAAHFAEAIPPRAATFTPGVDPGARLDAAVDETVLPALVVDRVTLDGTELPLLDRRDLRVAEGGLLRAHAFLADASDGGELVVEGRVDDQAFLRRVAVQPAPSPARLRRAAYRDQLAAWMRSYQDQPDVDRKARIVEVSLREGIPTAFTSLQVDDPELSLVAIKPGDPTLTVDADVGVTDVVAWYPFGDMRRLVRTDHPEKGEAFTDRFLVPRYWKERAYRVEVFSRHADGHVSRSDTWYVLDEAAPDARITLADGRLTVDTGGATPDIGAVEVHGPGQSLRLALDAGPQAEATTWTVAASELPPEFSVVVRDRAGNVLRLPGRVEDGALVLEGPARPSAAPDLPVEAPPARMASEHVELDGAVALVHLADRSLRVDLGMAREDLRSLQLTAALSLSDDRVLLGTRGGDLLIVDGVAAETATARRLDAGAEHPVTGLAALPDGRVLVGVLGQGLKVLEGDRLRSAPWRIGSRFVTGVVADPAGDVLVGTAYDGLWRIVGDRAVKSRFPHDHVAGLAAPGDLLAADPVLDLTVDSGFGRYTRLARDRYAFLDPGLNGRDVGADDLVDAVAVGDFLYVAGFDSGLWRRGPEGELSPVPLALSPDEARLNALALHGGRLFMATEGGLLSVDPDRPERGVVRHLDGAVLDLDASARGLAVAGKAGVLVLDDAGLRRVDVHGPLAAPLVGTGRYVSVAWHGGELFAGSLDGLVHLGRTADGGFAPVPVTVADGFAASWVTALHSDGATLWIGTYADGVWALAEDGIGQVPGLADQWVAPGALARVGDDLWVGGIGMPPARLDLGTGQARAVALPVRDVNAVVPDLGGGLLVVTSDGLVTVRDRVVAAR